MWLLENLNIRVSHYISIGHRCDSHVSNNWNDWISRRLRSVCVDLGWRGRVAHGNNQLPSYLLVEVSAGLQLPEKKASKAATCGQVDRRLLAGIRGCVDGGPGLQQMPQTIHLREKNSSSTALAFVKAHALPGLNIFLHSKNLPTLKRLDLATPSGQ